MGCAGCRGDYAAPGGAGHGGSVAPDTGCPQCELDVFVRNNYFTGKMMGAGEFQTETRYHGDKQRHHNLRLHGAGVVCGLKVRQHESPDCRSRFLVVEPGSALDCCGHEILVTAPEIVELGHDRELLRVAGDGRLHTLALCLAYRECPTDEVPLLYDECGCDDTQCAPNRILESFSSHLQLDPPLPDAQLMAAAARGAISASNRHAATGFVAAVEGGRVALVDPADASRVLLLDPQRRALKLAGLQAPARAIAASANGKWVFVAQAPEGGASTGRLRVFRGDDLTEVTPATGNAANWNVPDAPATAAITLAAGNDRLYAYNGASGKLHVWAGDATRGIADGSAPVAHLLAAGLSELRVEPGNGAAVALGPVTAGQRQIRRYALPATPGAGAITPTVLPATGTASALASGTVGNPAKTLLAAASADDRRAYLIDPAAGSVAAQVDFDHPPIAIGLLPAADGSTWLHALLDAGGVLYAQAALLRRDSANLQVDVAAARLAGNGPNLAVVLADDGRAAHVHAAALAEGDCADHLWKQLEACPGCSEPDCLHLATIANYKPGMPLLDLPAAVDDLAQGRARIDNRSGRRLLASTATLQSWLQCLQLKGGVPGPAGPGGPAGPTGPGIERVIVNWLPAGSPGTASYDGTTRELTLGIPGGEDGLDGFGIDAVTASFIDPPAAGSATLVDQPAPSRNKKLVLVIPKGANGTNGVDGFGIDAVSVSFVDPPATGSATLVDQPLPNRNKRLVLVIPKGANGIDGKDGVGLEKDLVQLREISWRHNQPTARLDEIDLRGNRMPALWLRFTAPVFIADHGSQFLSPQVLRVFIPETRMQRHPTRIDQMRGLMEDRFGRLCECPLSGIVVPAQLAGPGLLKTVPTSYSDLWAFVPSQAALKLLIDAASLRVELHGDFVIDEQCRAVDVEYARAELPSGDRPRGSEYGIQGGVFTSWTWMGRDLPELGGHPDGKRIDLNTGNVSDLVGVPGISAKLAAAIVRDRSQNGPYADVDDLHRRLKVCEVLFDAMRGALTA
ncbi:helix-hairpin-helix domain-containing protein [Ramlibacter sp. PS3R-8]|uniref:ComEA family DNA-binding protein n=1 Tax=Ramlibacter sp. PS3R-8 TaxID=3133437 RepID=UPI0030AA8F91